MDKETASIDSVVVSGSCAKLTVRVSARAFRLSAARIGEGVCRIPSAHAHVFAVEPFVLLHQDVLQDLVVKDLRQLQTVLRKVWKQHRIWTREHIVNQVTGGQIKSG